MGARVPLLTTNIPWLFSIIYPREKVRSTRIDVLKEDQTFSRALNF